jgi:DNA-3-methyladenine glycosylase
MEMEILPKRWFNRSSTDVAPDLIGCTLVRIIDGIKIYGLIVETEAYSIDDPACHAYKKVTKRNKIMFGESGFVYVYQIYGLHFCFNIVTDAINIPSAVLLRAVEFQIEDFSKFTNFTYEKFHRIGSGPGKLCKILQINKSLSERDLSETSGIYVCQRKKEFSKDLANKNKTIVQTSRIGITKGLELNWRWYLKESRSVSVRAPEERLPLV